MHIITITESTIVLINYIFICMLIHQSRKQIFEDDCFSQTITIGKLLKAIMF